MVPSAGSARPQLKRGLMSSALIWRTRSSMVRLLTESKAPGGHNVGGLYSVALLYACPAHLSRVTEPWAAFKLRPFCEAAIMTSSPGRPEWTPCRECYLQ